MSIQFPKVALILLLFFGFILNCAAQEDEKPFSRHSFELGLGVSPVWPDIRIKTSSKSVIGITEKSVFPPAIYFCYSSNIGSLWDFNSQIGFKGLQNSSLIFKDLQQPYSNIEYEYLDTFALRMNAMTLETSFKKFRYGAHGKGLYLFAGAGMTFIRTQVYTSFTEVYRESTNPDNIFEEFTTTRIEPWSKMTVTGSISGGIGAQLSYRELGYVDFGCRMNYHINTNEDVYKSLDYNSNPDQTDKENYDYQTEFGSIINRMARTNALRSYFIEFYVKIGITK